MYLNTPFIINIQCITASLKTQVLNASIDMLDGMFWLELSLQASSQDRLSIMVLRICITVYRSPYCYLMTLSLLCYRHISCTSVQYSLETTIFLIAISVIKRSHFSKIKVY
jgi:hypothetical protein